MPWALTDTPADGGGQERILKCWTVRPRQARAIVDQLYRETEKALRTPGVLDKFKPQGIEPMPMTSAEFDALIKNEIDINIALVKAANLKFN